MNEEDASVSKAVVPPSAIIHAVTMANICENALTARLCGDERPTISTDTVWRLFWSVYARITGIESLSRSQNSARTRSREYGFSSEGSIHDEASSIGLDKSEVYSFGRGLFDTVSLLESCIVTECER